MKKMAVGKKKETFRKAVDLMQAMGLKEANARAATTAARGRGANAQ
ncbi:MAG: hypothetical protein LBL46_01045 [Rickettsiales bacterium]|nr:hypothetical protein [Rickettsiales bacterium]